MKLTEFPLKRLDDFAAEMDREVLNNPLKHSPFSLHRSGECISTWEMTFRKIGLLRYSGGCNIFGDEEIVFITVPATETGIHPLVTGQPFGWTGKINEYVAEMAVEWAFELISSGESAEFMQVNRPSVIFSYSDSDGMGEVSVKYNGRYWVFV